MVGLYLVSAILYALLFFLLKNIETIDHDEFVLKVWHVLLLVIAYIVPYFNIFAVLVLLIMISITGEFKKSENSNSKLYRFLNKKI